MDIFFILLKCLPDLNVAETSYTESTTCREMATNMNLLNLILTFSHELLTSEIYEIMLYL